MGARVDSAYISETARLLGHRLGIRDLSSFVAELDQDLTIIRKLEKAVADEPFFRTKSWESPLELGTYRTILYCLARAIVPSISIETGVLHGLTSAYLLHAIDRNRQGRLISVDLPSYHESGPSNKDGYNDTLPPNREPGWVVEPSDRERWSLVLGSTKEKLPQILKDAGWIDLFLHDSEHTHETMTFELNEAWPRLSAKGILVCDNVDSNTAFFDFCYAIGRPPIVISDGRGAEIRFGLLRKSPYE